MANIGVGQVVILTDHRRIQVVGVPKKVGQPGYRGFVLKRFEAPRQFVAGHKRYKIQGDVFLDFSSDQILEVTSDRFNPISHSSGSDDAFPSSDMALSCA